jgi:hypothetical protein
MAKLKSKNSKTFAHASHCALPICPNKREPFLDNGVRQGQGLSDTAASGEWEGRNLIEQTRLSAAKMRAPVDVKHAWSGMLSQEVQTWSPSKHICRP